MILVTGATGFIGSHLMCHLAQKDIFPVAMFRHESNKKRVWKQFESQFADAQKRFDKITWRKADFRDLPSLDAAFEGISHVYHCAGYISLAQRDAKKLLEINEKGSAYLVNLCLSHSVKKLVYVSSIAALGNDPSISVIDENTPWDNNIDKNPYAYSKYGGEMEVWRAMQEGLNAVIVNPGIVLGKDSPIETLLLRHKKGLRWCTTGNNAFVNIQDVITLMDKLMDSKIEGERFILVAENWSGKVMVETLLKSGDFRPRVFFIPKGFLYFLWGLEHLMQLLGIRRRFLTRAIISGQYEQKTIDGSKIKSFVDFEYSPITKLIFD
ncbi:MAG: NAD-dependent epimerase/dehydratase family protein [Flavobacteriaceae bacterium]|jgi:nucleoside-diphosphate-sugar epimerase|nr:NAD-dependent epimerase/dehydratase family protein [Flavobacteriaceae bacterium]|tara:strand:+ start:50 stop:1021 length:972 start_codon:yes stop_codon:yes gene_type:complete